ncbi:2-dehydropantoate 2-reductase [Candidatus Woesearchaeota archaeon]|nr:2-dehydropantoate 2-reductase [Candidatus Woesearchaeota archaeon]
MKNINNIIILGAGALGSVYGALLSKNKDNKVVLVGNKKHIAVIKNNKLQIQGRVNESFALAVQEKITSLSPQTIIFLMVKCYDIIPTLKSIKPTLRKDTILVCLSNGLEIKELVLKEIGDYCTVIRGISYLGCIFLEPGKIVYTGGSFTELEKTSHDQQFHQMFENTGLNLKTYQNFKEREFKKAIMNAMINPLTSIFNCYTCVLAEKRYENLINKLISECKCIAEKEGVVFKEDFLLDFKTNIQETSNNKSSMLQDIERGKKTEIDYINGKFVELAKKHHLQAPLNTALVTLIKTLEQNNDA